MHHHKTYKNIIFCKIGFVDQSKTVYTQIYLQKNRKLHKFATTNSNFEKISIISDMRHRKTYMYYINLQQNWVNRSVITVHTNLFAKNRKLHKFATCN